MTEEFGLVVALLVDGWVRNVGGDEVMGEEGGWEAGLLSSRGSKIGLESCWLV